MIRFAVKWLLRGAAVLVALFALVYVGDWAVYQLRGAPQSKVTVNRYVSVPLKGRKTEFDYLGTIDQPCAIALFAQSGESPCWQLRKNPNLGISM